MYSMYEGFAGLLIPNPRDLDDLVKQIGKYKTAFIRRSIHYSMDWCTRVCLA